MNKTLLFLAFMILLASTTRAQRGNNALNLAIEAGFPAGDFSTYKTGVGFLGKGLLGVGDRGQVSFTSGYSIFSQKDPPANTSIKMAVVPLLLGYKYNWTLLYVHPQMGYGVYKSKTKIEVNGTQTKIKTSEGGFTLAAGAGVQLRELDFGVRYQAGFPGDGTIGYFGFHAGYNFLSRIKRL